MDIRILGAHRCESPETGCVCFLIDGKIAIDAGALTSRLSMTEQEGLDAILLTHLHYDHIRDIPGIALSCARHGSSINIYATDNVRDNIERHIFNGKVYPRFQSMPDENPTVVLNTVCPYCEHIINGYSVLPVPVKHEGMTVGYQVGNGNGRRMFYTSDTGPGLAECWEYISPDLLIIDVTLPDSEEAFARQTRHLTPGLLKTELLGFRSRRGYLPRIITVHMDAGMETTIRQELAAVAVELATEITVAREGMELHV